MSAHLTWGALLRRQTRTELGTLVVLALTTLLVTTALTVWPRAVERMVRADLVDRVAAQSHTARDLTLPAGFLLRTEGVPSAEEMVESLTANTQGATEMAAGSGDALAGVLGPASVVAERAEVLVDTGDRRPDIARMGLTALTDLDVGSHVRVVDGRAPGAYDPGPAEGTAFAMLTSLPPVEVMVSVETATEMGWQIGETREADDEAAFPATFVLTGTFEATDPDESYWGHLPSTLVPYVEPDDNAGWTVHGVAITDPTALAALVSPGGVEVSVWYPVDAAAVGRADRTALVGDLERIRTQQGLRSETTAVVAATATREATIGAVVDVLAVGAAGAAVGVLWLAAVLAVDRRRPALVLLRARGASGLRLRTLLAAQGLLAAVPAGVLGIVLGSLAVDAPVPVSGLVLPVLATLLPAALLAVVPGGAHRAGRRGPVVHGPWRWVAEVLVVLAAAASLVTVSRRGVTAAPGDPLVVALPLLLGLAAGVLVLRLVPWPLRAVLAAARRRRGVGVFLGAAQAARAPAAGVVPVVALVMGVASLVLSVVTVSTLEGAAAQGAVRTVGADLRLDRYALAVSGGVGISEDEIAAARAVDGVEALAAVGDGRRRAYTSGRSSGAVELVVADLADLRAVQAGRAGLDPLPATTGATGVPVLVADGLDLDLDADLAVLVGADLDPVALAPVGSATSVPGVVSGQTWLLADRETWQQASGLTADVTRLLVRLEPGADPVAVAAALEQAVGSTRALTVQDAARTVAGATLVDGMRTLVLGAAALGLVLCATVLALLLLTGARTRGRMTALLRTLGAPAPVRRLLVLAEAATPLVTAGIGGLVVGAVLPVLVLGSTDLRLFTGGAEVPSLMLDPGLAVGTVAAGLLAATAGVALAVRAARRVHATAVLREGEGA